MSNYALPLPYYADPSGANESPAAVPSPPAGQTKSYKPDSGYIEDVLNFTFSFVAAATVGTRVPGLQMLDPDGLAVWTVNSPVSLTAGQGGVFLFARSAPSAYGVAGGVIVTFVPLGYLYPSYSLAVICANLAAGDQISGIVVTRVQIPTQGMARQASQIPAVAQPLLT